MKATEIELLRSAFSHNNDDDNKHIALERPQLRRAD